MGKLQLPFQAYFPEVWTSIVSLRLPIMLRVKILTNLSPLSHHNLNLSSITRTSFFLFGDWRILIKLSHRSSFRGMTSVTVFLQKVKGNYLKALYPKQECVPVWQLPQIKWIYFAELSNAWSFWSYARWKRAHLVVQVKAFGEILYRVHYLLSMHGCIDSFVHI